MHNFFEGDVAGNIAALLGIDPSNIRVTNIVRESRSFYRDIWWLQPHEQEFQFSCADIDSFSENTDKNNG